MRVLVWSILELYAYASLHFFSPIGCMGTHQWINFSQTGCIGMLVLIFFARHTLYRYASLALPLSFSRILLVYQRYRYDIFIITKHPLLIQFSQKHSYFCFIWNKWLIWFTGFHLIPHLVYLKVCGMLAWEMYYCNFYSLTDISKQFVNP